MLLESEWRGVGKPHLVRCPEGPGEEASRGLANVVYLAVTLSGLAALDAENAVKAARVDAGEKPVGGREYFDISTLALIYDVASSWLPRQHEQVLTSI